MAQHIISRSGWCSAEHDVAMIGYAACVSGKKRAKVLFLNTASSSTPRYLENAQKTIEAVGCEYSTLDLFGSIREDYSSFIMSHDVVYVGGGNTRSLVALWKEYGIDKILQEASTINGTILTGFSAGGICWFEQCLTDSLAGEPQTIKGLGFLKGSACPHYDVEALRRPTYIKKVIQGEILPGYALRDFSALHFIDGELFKALTTQKGKAPAYVGLDGVEKDVSVEFYKADV
ncbi:MAG: peptidase E [Alphaproteobacteria bacterium]